MDKVTITVQILLLLLSGVCAAKTKPNILFLMSDDMRQQLNCYRGSEFPSATHPEMYTPHLDKLAEKSLFLKKAYVQQALCNPSRSSLLTGRRPDTTHVYKSRHYFRKTGGDFVTIPQYFKQQGYTTIGVGKIFHPGSKSSGCDDPQSWSLPYYHAPNEKIWNRKHHGSWKAVNKRAQKKKELPDVQVTEQAIRVLKELASNESSEPFFLAVGFYKPHMPFIFPRRFLNHYPPESISLPDNPHAPVNLPAVAWHNYGGIGGYPDMKGVKICGKFNTTLPDAKAIELRRAYYSAVSYIDHLIGLILNQVEELGLDKNTIVSFVGDHGWHLGENGEWTKQTNFEMATHAPMMLHIPGVTDHGITTRHVTEFVDFFPTLVEAAGFPSLPTCPEDSSTVRLCTEGRSLMPIVASNGTVIKDWIDVAFSQFPRSNKKQGVMMGYSLRTFNYRYTEWPQFSGPPDYKPDWRTLYGVELHDHQVDPGETYNRAHDNEYHEIRRILRARLRAGWRTTLQLTH